MDVSSVSSSSSFLTPTSTSQTSAADSSAVSRTQPTSTNPAQSQVATQAFTQPQGTTPLSQQPVPTTGSALFGNSSAGSSVLGAFNSDDASSLFGGFASQTSTLLTQVEATLNTQLEQQLQLINDTAAQAMAVVNDQNQRWITVKSQINTAQVAVSNGQDSINKVSNTLLDMETSVGSVGEKGEDPKYWKEQFDTQLNSINIESESAAPTSNLVGNIDPVDLSTNTIEYQSNINGAQSTLIGTNIGSTFTIQTTNGEQWVLDNQSDILQAYSEGGSKAETYKTQAGDTVAKATSTHSGLKLVSYDPKTKAIAVDISVVPEDPPLVVTGKLQSAGIGLMGAWFYNNFATQADRNHAFADISAAETNLVSSQATLQMAASQTAQDQKNADDALHALTLQSDAITQKQQDETQAAQAKTAQQFLAIQANLQNMSDTQSNYLQAFAGFLDDPLAQVSLDISA